MLADNTTAVICMKKGGTILDSLCHKAVELLYSELGYIQSFSPARVPKQPGTLSEQIIHSGPQMAPQCEHCGLGCFTIGAFLSMDLFATHHNRKCPCFLLFQVTGWDQYQMPSCFHGTRNSCRTILQNPLFPGSSSSSSKIIAE